MKRFSILVTVLLLGFGLSTPLTSEAQTTVQLGPRVGIPVADLSDAGGNFFFGADARFHNEALPVVPNASFDFYLTDSDNVSIFTIDLNALYEFGDQNMSFTPYAGGGLGITRLSFDSPSVNVPGGGTIGGGSTSDTDIGLNLVGGARFMAGSVEPFVQGNATIGGDATRFGISGGILFTF